MSTNTPQTPTNTLMICPLLSANSEYNKMCVQDRCAWYMKSAKACAATVLGHESILKIKTLQSQAQKPQA